MAILYGKISLGLYGREISILKIKTMIDIPESELKTLIETNGLDSHGKIIDDPRITRLGKILRKYWVDEIPQVYSLFKGDLKPVGIRPMREIDWRSYPENIKERALMQKPGLMGIQYAFPRSSKLEEQIDNMRTYLDEYDDDPFGTDLKYFRMISRAILVKGVRSR